MEKQTVMALQAWNACCVMLFFYRRQEKYAVTIAIRLFQAG
ncbi:hypothetical protein ACO0LO_17350 [Undibacterium sp. TJN25]